MNSRLGIERVLVYGSRATGTFRPASDIDLAIVAPAMPDGEFARLWNALDDLPIVFKLDVSHTARTSNHALLKNISSHGVELYRPPPTVQASADQPHSSFRVGGGRAK